MKRFQAKKEVIRRLIVEPINIRYGTKEQRLRRSYATIQKRKKIKPDRVVYEADQGRGMQGSPYALFVEFFKRPDFNMYEHIWVINQIEEQENIIRAYRGYHNIKFVQRDTKQYIKYLATAKYLVNNVAFPTYFTKSCGQVYLNTGHSRRKNDTCEEEANQIRNLLCSDYLLSANEISEKRYKEQDMLAGIYAKQIIRSGYPRTDFLKNTNRYWIEMVLREYGVEIDESRRRIVYIPSDRSENTQPEKRCMQYIELLQYMESHIGKNGDQFLIRPSRIEYEWFGANKKKRANFLPPEMDVDQLLTITDVLVTDDSEYYLDYLIMERPIIFYIPEKECKLENKEDVRPEAKLPGPIVRSHVQLEQAIMHIPEIKKEYLPRIVQRKTQFCPYEDGKVSYRVLNLLLEGTSTMQAVNRLDQDKKKLLLYTGTFQGNEEMISLLSILKLLDKTKYDLTVYYEEESKEQSSIDRSQFPNEVRFIKRVGTYNATTCEEFFHGLILEFGLTKKTAKKGYPKELYQREFQRCFGETTFDCCIDFSGKSPLISMVLMASRSARKIIWQHTNTSKAKAERGVVESLYERFDQIVVSSIARMEKNRNRLVTKETDPKFCYAKMPLDEKRILSKVQQEMIINREDGDYLVLDASNIEKAMDVKRMVRIPKRGTINFCTIGRINDENNQFKLLLAFHKLYKTNLNIRLYLIGEGEGVGKIESYRKANHLLDVVILTGSIKNPFPLIARCDCLVVSSGTEEQERMALETRIIGIPIIVSERIGDETIEKKSDQYVTGMTVEELYKGMQAFIEGKVPDNTYDYNAYNKEAVSEFEALLQ